MTRSDSVFSTNFLFKCHLKTKEVGNPQNMQLTQTCTYWVSYYTQVGFRAKCSTVRHQVPDHAGVFSESVTFTHILTAKNYIPSVCSGTLKLNRGVTTNHGLKCSVRGWKPKCANAFGARKIIQISRLSKRHGVKTSKNPFYMLIYDTENSCSGKIYENLCPPQKQTPLLRNNSCVINLQ